MFERTHNHGAHAILTQVERQTVNLFTRVRRWKCQQFAGHGLIEAINTCDAVVDRRDHTLVSIHNCRVETGDALFQDVADFVTAYCHLSFSFLLPAVCHAMALCSCCRRVRTLLSITWSPMRTT